MTSRRCCVRPSAAAKSRCARLGAARVDRPRRILGATAADQPRAHHPAWLRRSCTGPAPWTTSGWPPAPRATYRADADSGGALLPFLDSDVYKWLEAVGWELGRGADPGLARRGGRGDRGRGARPSGPTATSTASSRSSAAASRTATSPGATSSTASATSIQAAVAWHRALGDDRLLDDRGRAPPPHRPRARRRTVARGSTATPDRDGARRARPHHRRTSAISRSPPGCSTCAAAACSATGGSAPAYWQDHEPGPRGARRSPGTPCASSTSTAARSTSRSRLGDEDLLAAVRRRWHDMVRTRRYLTGGLGSRHRDEAFGDPYELPPDRAYAETCAAIASVMLAWRLLLATGEPGYADAIERADVQRRAARRSRCRARSSSTSTRCSGGPTAPSSRPARRPAQPWYACACCPPNLMRLLSSWQQYLATADDAGIQLHQYADGTIMPTWPAVRCASRSAPTYPWDGASPSRSPDARPSRGRSPCGCRRGAVGDADGRAGEATASRPAPGRIGETRTWQAGDGVLLDLGMPPGDRAGPAHRRRARLRGVRTRPTGVLRRVGRPAGRRRTRGRSAGIRPSSRWRSRGRTCRGRRSAWPCRPSAPPAMPRWSRRGPVLRLGHRRPGAMRVWIPTRSHGADAGVARRPHGAAPWSGDRGRDL